MTDPFSSARSAFTTLDDLMGRLILVRPKELRTEVSTLPNANGKTYEKVIADVIVLDGDPDDKIETIPMTLEDQHISGVAIVGQLKPAAKKKIDRGGIVLGRLGKVPSKTKGFGPAWILNDPEDEDKELARPEAMAYIEANKANEEPDPFASADAASAATS